MSEGKLELLGVRTCFTPTETYVQIQRSLEETGSQYLIYQSAKKAGYDWFKVMSEAYPGMKQSEALKWGIDIVSLAGWGITELSKVDPEQKKATFTIRNSSIAKIYGKSESSVDHLFRGLVAGGVSFILKSELDCVESKCVAKGDTLCQFIVGKLDELNVPPLLLHTHFGL